MIILAIDTATGPCSVAVWKNNGVAVYLENLKPTSQSACLLPMIEQALADASIGYGDLNAIACTTGPGSFTGIRVGLAAARGIAFAAGIAGLGFTTLEVMAYGALAQAPSPPVLAMLNAGKGEVYYQTFDDLPTWRPTSNALLADRDTALQALEPPFLVAGNTGFGRPGSVEAGIAFPRADALARLAAEHTASAREMAPFYIRAPDAKLPGRQLQLLSDNQA